VCRPQNRTVQKTLVVDKNVCEESHFILLYAFQNMCDFRFVCYYLIGVKSMFYALCYVPHVS